MDTPDPARYAATFPLRTADLDAWGELPPATIAAFLEQTAREASAARGFDEAWYQAQNSAWVIHRLTLACLGSAAYPETLHAETWITSIGRARSRREYEVRRADGAPVAAGGADWAYVDRRRQAPQGIDRTIAGSFTLGAPTPLLVALPPAAPPAAAPRSFTTERRAYRYEADSMGHINNTVYLTWLDEALADALAAAGLPLAAPAAPGLRLRGLHYAVAYPRSARPGDALTIRSTLAGVAGPDPVLAWTQEIARADGTVLVRAASRQAVLGLDVAGLVVGDVVAALLT